MIRKLLLIFFLFIQVNNLFAKEEPVKETVTHANDVRPVIDKVMQSDELSTEVSDTRWVLKNRNKDEEKEDFSFFKFSESTIQFISFFSKYILWGILLFLLYLGLKHRIIVFPQLNNLFTKSDDKEEPVIIQPRTTARLYELDEIYQQYYKNNQRTAFAQLYNWLVNKLEEKTDINIPEYVTEGDILRLLSKLDNIPSDIYRQGIRYWIDIAYGHKTIASEEFEVLYNQLKTLES